MMKPKVGWTFTILVGLYLILFLPFWKPVILGFLFASAAGPLERRIREKLHTSRKPIAYSVLILSTLLVVALVAILGVQIYGLIYQAVTNTDELAGLTQKLTGAHDSIWAWLESKNLVFSTEWQQQLDKIVANTLVSLKSVLLIQAQAFFASTPEVLLNIFIFTLAFAAFLLMGGKVFMSVTSVFGVEGNHAQQFQRFEKICFVSLGSVILIGLMQATLVVIGAWICSIGNYFLILAITFIFSMIPLLGAGLVPIGILVFNLVQGDTFSAVVMGATALITGVADNVLKAWLFSKAAKTNPIISMISLIGGITLMGFAGLFIAPTIEQLVMAEYHRRKEIAAQRGELT